MSLDSISVKMVPLFPGNGNREDVFDHLFFGENISHSSSFMERYVVFNRLEWILKAYFGL